MEAVILVFILFFIIMFFKRFTSFVYGVAMIDILLRILDFVRYNINVKEISSFISNYFPSSILSIINRHSSGIINDILSWAFIAIMALFLYYTVKVFMRRKK
ncbi:MAG: hypothetical protein PHD02_01330 [Bacilli bacterium]|nr:hypothetical protein [Bacilli bacterium]